MKPIDCPRCIANDALILKLKQEIERLQSRVKTRKKKATRDIEFTAKSKVTK